LNSIQHILDIIKVLKLSSMTNLKINCLKPQSFDNDEYSSNNL